MKKIINPFTGKEDYLMIRKEVAEELEMSLGQLNFRWSENPKKKLHKCFIPPRKIIHGIPKALLSEIRTFKENSPKTIKKPKVDVEKETDKTKKPEIIPFKKKSN